MKWIRELAIDLAHAAFWYALIALIVLFTTSESLSFLYVTF